MRSYRPKKRDVIAGAVPVFRQGFCLNPRGRAMAAPHGLLNLRASGNPTRRDARGQGRSP